MKKRIALMLCIVMLLSLVLTGCSKTFQVETDLTDLKLKGESEIKGGEDYEATLTPKGDFVLPEEITVKIDGSKLSAKKYTYDAETGEILIPGDEITGDVEIIAEGVELTLVGEWVGTIDLTDIFNDMVLSEIGDEMPAFTGFHDICLVLRMDFTEDSCTMYVDEDSVETLVSGIRDQMLAFLEDYLQIILEQSGSGMTMDDVLAFMGYSSLEEMVDDLFEVNLLASAFTDIGSTGSYAAEDGLLYIADTPGVDPFSVTPNPYTLSGNTLVIDGTGEEDDVEAAMYPLVLSRVS